VTTVDQSKPLTIGITTRNRPDDLLRTVVSLAHVAALVREILVVDGGSEPPTEPGLRAALPADFPIPVHVIRFDPDPGFILSRNRIVQRATTEFVLNLDDDIELLSADAVSAALAVIRGDRAVAAIAFAQANPDGSPWPPGSQPSRSEVPAEVPSYIGFAHLLRRDVFLQLGGYRSHFHYGAEEKEFCLRLLDAQWKVVYLPEARIVHFTSAVGRDSRRWLRMNARNQLLADLMNLPALLVPPYVAWHVVQYFYMRRICRIADPWGFWWVLRETVRMLPQALHDRKAIHFGTYRRWQALRQRPRPYLAGI
jgi:GT2 family glycosyltransferase